MRTLSLLGLTSIVAGGYAHPERRIPHQPLVATRSITIDKYDLPQRSEYNPSNVVQDFEVTRASSVGDTYVETATDLVRTVFPDVEFRVVKGHYVGKNGIAHVYLKQTVHGIDIDNADFNVNVNPDGSILSYGNSFFTGILPTESPLQKRDFSDPVAALYGAIGALAIPVTAESPTAEANHEEQELYRIKGTSGAVSDPEAQLVYFVQGDESLALTWRVETNVRLNWLLTYVDVNESDVVAVVDYVSEFATYEVYPWGVSDPTEGDRVIIEDPWLLSASHFTWQSNGTANFTSPRGNNAIAHVNEGISDNNWETKYRPDVSNRSFEFPYSPSMTNKSEYRDASITQLFYTANKYHDVLYTLGFTEAAGNFQLNNNDQGGIGGDFVALNAQDPLGMNNALFSVGVDGRQAQMLVFMFNRTTPNRDASFDAGIVIHEYTHGVSSRLTGGPNVGGCLSGRESAGMGEGWSDIFALAILLKPNDSRDTDHAMGTWVSGDPRGVRIHPYSTSTTINPLTYSSANTVTNTHAVGTVWCTALYEVLWNLIDKHGKSHEDFPVYDADGVPTDGKFLTLQLVLDGMALQPCTPTMVQARDAIIDADRVLTGGDNLCEIWTGFAKRGLGENALYDVVTRVDDFTIPSGVC